MLPRDSHADLCVAYEAARHGDQAAAKFVYDWFYPRLRRIVRRSLAAQLRRICDPEDIIQDAWVSLLKCSRPRFALPRLLIGYVEKTAWHKALETNRTYLELQRHNLNREVHVDVLTQLAVSSYPELEIPPERWDELLAKVTAGQRRVLTLVMRGETHESIANHMGFTSQTLRRVFRRVIVRQVLET